MNIAILLFDQFTALDAVGPYEVLSRLPGAKVTFVAKQAGVIRTDVGSLGITADASIADIEHVDILLVPGGPGINSVLGDAEIEGWIRQLHETSTWTTSVCTGSILLASAGVLDGLAATCHWSEMDRLTKLGAIATRERVVFSGKVVSAAGVSSGIDMALALAARISGDLIAQVIQLGIEYDPAPPFDSGSIGKAPLQVEKLARLALTASAPR